jgi:hypothetical protein
VLVKTVLQLAETVLMLIEAMLELPGTIFVPAEAVFRVS